MSTFHPGSQINTETFPNAQCPLRDSWSSIMWIWQINLGYNLSLGLDFTDGRDLKSIPTLLMRRLRLNEATLQPQDHLTIERGSWDQNSSFLIPQSNSLFPMTFWNLKWTWNCKYFEKDCSLLASLSLVASCNFERAEGQKNCLLLIVSINFKDVITL